MGNRNYVWYRLDSAAKLFAAVSNEKSTNVFRLTTMLTEEIDKELLQLACNRALRMFPPFRTRLKRGFFWYYLESNPGYLQVEEEESYPCAFIPYTEPPYYLIRVSYFGRRFHVEMSHMLADGGGGWAFMRYLACCYLKLKHPKELSGAKPPEDTFVPLRDQMENSYLRYYSKFGLKSPFRRKTYTITGKKFPVEKLQVVQGVCKTKAMLAVTKKYKASVTEFLAAAVIHSIHQANTDGKDKTRAIAINLPVNLRTYFPTRSTRNFFASIGVDYTYKEEASFEEVLESVKAQSATLLTKEMLEKYVNYAASAERNITMFTPLAIKNIYLRGAHARAESAFSTAVSNIGRITMPEEFRPYIENMDGIMAPSKYHTIKFSVSSFYERMTLSFTGRIETDIHKYFFDFINSQGIDLTMWDNGVQS